MSQYKYQRCLIKLQQSIYSICLRRNKEGLRIINLRGGLVKTIDRVIQALIGRRPDSGGDRCDVEIDVLMAVRIRTISSFVVNRRGHDQGQEGQYKRCRHKALCLVLRCTVFNHMIYWPFDCC